MTFIGEVNISVGGARFTAGGRDVLLGLSGGSREMLDCSLLSLLRVRSVVSH